MGANGSYDKYMDCVPEERRTHIETGYRIMGHPVLLQADGYGQTKNIMNSNSESPMYLMAKLYPDGTLKVLNINDFSSHKITFEVNLKFDASDNIIPFNGKESGAHAHEWIETSNYIMGRKDKGDASHLPIPEKYNELIEKISEFNKHKNKLKE